MIASGVSSRMRRGVAHEAAGDARDRATGLGTSANVRRDGSSSRRAVATPRGSVVGLYVEHVEPPRNLLTT